MKTRKKVTPMDGYIEKRHEDGVMKYFAQVENLAYIGPLRDTEEEATEDGRRWCEKVGAFIPCFFEMSFQEYISSL